MWTYRLIPDLPPPPGWLIDQIDFNNIPTVNDTGGYGRRVLTNWLGLTGVPVRNVIRNFCDEFEHWAREHIAKDFQRAVVNYADGSPEKHSTGAHTDQTRDSVLIYNVRTGGPNAKLCFWQEKGQPLVRDRAVEISDIDCLNLVDSITGPEHCWYLINARVLHSVENLSELRCNLQITFEHKNPWFA